MIHVLNVRAAWLHALVLFMPAGRGAGMPAACHTLGRSLGRRWRITRDVPRSGCSALGVQGSAREGRPPHGPSALGAGEVCWPMAHNRERFFRLYRLQELGGSSAAKGMADPAKNQAALGRGDAGNRGGVYVRSSGPAHGEGGNRRQAQGHGYFLRYTRVKSPLLSVSTATASNTTQEKHSVALAAAAGSVFS